MSTLEVAQPDSGKRLPPLSSLTLNAAVFAFLTAFAILLNDKSWHLGGGTILWPANGFLLAVLLCAPRRQWAAYLTLGYVINLLISLALLDSSATSFVLSGCNSLEIGLAALLLCPHISRQQEITNRKQLTYLLAYGVVLAPAAAALLAAIYKANGASASLPSLFMSWYLEDALGIAIMVPLYFSFLNQKAFRGHHRGEVSGLFALLIAITAVVFRQASLPLLFLVFPFLLLLGVRLRIAGSAIGLLIVAAMGDYFTSAGHGPMAFEPLSSPAARSLVLQLFLAVSMVVLYIVEVVIAERSRLQLHLEASEGRFRLLAEVSRDIIVLSELDGKRQYVSPAVTEALGWLPTELIDDRYEGIVHPEDIPLVERMFAECREGREMAAVSYRCRNRNGGYLWMESNLRLYNDPVSGDPMGIVNVVRDVTSRKAAEDKLKKAFDLVEELASSDGLTGIANRRRLDMALDKEWRRAIRDRAPLSFLLIDVDHFKSYNDLYGHLHGDNCLRRIATAVQAIMHRPGDVLARYGGEEFAVVLPNTESSGAQMLADQLRIAVEELQIPHQGNSHGVVTISVGCATHVPERDSAYDLLLAAADRALYRAKSMGRNRTEIAINRLGRTNGRPEVPISLA